VHGRLSFNSGPSGILPGCLSRQNSTPKSLGWRYRPLTLLWRGPAFTDDAAVLTALFGLTSHQACPSCGSSKSAWQGHNEDWRISSLWLRLGAISSRACWLCWLTLQGPWSQPSSCRFRLRPLPGAFPHCVLAPPAVPYVPLYAGLLDASSPSLCAHPA